MNITYPERINVGQEPPGFTFKEQRGTYSYHTYGDATYYWYKGATFHFLQGFKKSEGLIKATLQKSQVDKNKCKMYVAHNTLTGKDMMLYKKKIAFKQKGSLTRSFINYMKYIERITDFDNNDFQKLVAAGLIEVRELT